MTIGIFFEKYNSYEFCEKKKQLNFLEINDYCFELIMHNEHNNNNYFFPTFFSERTSYVK
jgi:hypothetical protein